MYHTEKITYLKFNQMHSSIKNILDLPNSYPTEYSQFPGFQFRFEVLTL